ncbi:MAG: ribonuclease E/G [Candidatus Shikimatogenerans sp. JK-2022]|nr:ribonuclease E/G [Candidatus Shikimatogenerans bostrichidophilus]
MIKNLIINKKNKIITIALLENKNLVELYKISSDNIKEIHIGDIFIGKIIFISKGMNAAFIDIGYIKYGFLNFKNFNNNNKIFFFDKKINNYLKIGQFLIVQIIKEPINNKGPKLTCKINFVGKYIIYFPYSNKIFISKKIKNKKIIKEKIKEIKKKFDKNIGFIIRTICKNKKIKFKYILNELIFFYKKWLIINNIFKKEKKIKKIYSEKNFLFTFLRDNIDKYYKYIICDNYKYYLMIISFILFLKIKNINIKYYNKNKNILNIFDKFNINRQMQLLLGKYVLLSNGSNLIIETTETLNIFDINSNMKYIKNYNISALKINLLAIKEIVRQIRLRNLGGIIIIDCIDINNKKHKRIIYKYINKLMLNDKLKHNILPLSQFNILQITRHRLRKELDIDNLNIKNNIYCFLKKIENFFNYYYYDYNNNNIILLVNPLIASYIKYGIFSYRIKWLFKYKKWINIINIYNFDIFEYKIYVFK